MRSFILSLGLLLATTTAANAELLKGQYSFSGSKMMLGADPLGVQVAFTNPYNNGAGVFVSNTLATYKFAINFSGKIMDTPKITGWMGGEFNLGGRDSLATIELGAVFTMTFEKLIPKIPLVPLASIALVIPLNVLYGFDNSFATGGLALKLGGGAYYFLIKQLGIGAETHLAFGFQAFSFNGGATTSAFYGYWDFVTGIRAVF